LQDLGRPFRPFFLFAAADGFLLGGLWLYSAYGFGQPLTLSADAWHRSDVLLGAPISRPWDGS
jgi:uncharacterized protein involved in response to NO